MPVIAAALSLALLLIGCASSGTIDNDSQPLPSADSGANTTLNDSTEPTPDSDNAALQEKLDWQTYTVTGTDDDGYTIETELTISSWVRSDDSELIKAAWDKVGGNGYDVPTSPSYYDFISENCDVMDFAFGTLTFRNKTDGFDISSQNAYKPTLFLDYGYYEENSYSETGYVFNVYGLQPAATLVLFCDNGAAKVQNVTTDLDYYDAHMVSNSWSAPFIIAVPEKITPNAPGGDEQEYMENGVFRMISSGFDTHQQTKSMETNELIDFTLDTSNIY